MKVLQLSCHFPPNIGGVETHLQDLVNALQKRGWEVTVLAYRPLTTKVNWKIYEQHTSVTIIRIPWLPGLFYALVYNPILEFLYLIPGLFIVTPIVLIVKNPEVIHAHGLVAGMVGLIWAKLFRKRIVVSTHSTYQFPKTGLFRNVVKIMFSHVDFILGLSNLSVEEIAKLNISRDKIGKFTYWINLQQFKPDIKAKKRLNWEKKFVVLFVGRLIPDKGVKELIEAADLLEKNITIAIVGSGPLDEYVKKEALKKKNILSLGKIINEKLPAYYSAADILVVPSTHEEGFGRVILESLACGTPVIGAMRGAIPDAMDNSVGELITVTPTNIKKTIEYYFAHHGVLEKLQKGCRPFALKRYSEKNTNDIIKHYK